MINDEQVVEKKPESKKFNYLRPLVWIVILSLLGLSAWQIAYFWSSNQTRIKTQLQAIILQNQQQSEQIQRLQAKLERLSTQLASKNTEFTIKMAEIGYMIQVAEHRLRYFQDTKTVNHILNSAKEKLSSWDTPEIQLLQEKLNSVLAEIQKSETRSLSDTITVIDQVMIALSNIPVSKPQSISHTVSPKPLHASNWQVELQQTWEHIKKLFVVKHIDGSTKPFLWPEERTLVLWNIRLELEQAKIALWRGEDKIYISSVQNTILWIKQYFNIETEPVQKILQDLETVSKVTTVIPEPHFEEMKALIQKILEKPIP